MEAKQKWPLISIIIPFYKGEKYIVQALESVLNQPYMNLEVLLINDGSPSGTAICESASTIDPRIQYFFKENEGIGATRNFGIEHANGEWMAFLDQDDVWVKNFLTDETVNLIVNAGDVVGFSYYACNHNFSRGNLVRMEGRTIPGSGEAAQSCKNHHSSMFYRKTVLSDQDIRYALTRHEDIIFLQKALYVAKHITYVDKVIFLYRDNELSETHRKQSVESFFVPVLNTWKGLLNWHLLKHPDDEGTIKTVKHMICVYAIEAVENLYKSGMNEAEAESFIDNYLCRDFLDNYKSLVLSENRLRQIGLYYDKRQEFILKQRKNRVRDKRNSLLKKYPLFRILNDYKKYREVLPKGLYIN